MTKPQPTTVAKTCKDSGTSGSPEICAQWRATVAAEKSAQAAQVSNLVGIGSMILSLIVLVFIAVGVFQTKRSLKHARRANEILDDTARKELRAYVVPRDQQIVGFAPGTKPAFVVKLYNSGQTPAYDVRCVTLMWATDGDPDEYRFFFRTKGQGIKFSRDVIGPGDFKLHANQASAPFDANVMGLIVTGRMNLIFGGIVSYRDVFGKRHLSTFRQFFSHDGADSGTVFDLSGCTTGNYGN